MALVGRIAGRIVQDFANALRVPGKTVWRLSPARLRSRGPLCPLVEADRLGVSRKMAPAQMWQARQMGKAFETFCKY